LDIFNVSIHLEPRMYRIAKLTLAATLTVVASASAQAGKSAFTLTSTEIKPGQMIAMPQVFNGMACTGGNISPALEWKGAPATAKSYAITVYDPDAPTGSGWWHWVVYNIPASTTKLPAGAGTASSAVMPAGTKQGNTDFGAPGYGGPCPPKGPVHHYIFTVFALDVASLDLPTNATAAMVGFNLNAHKLAKASFTAVYKQP
jgi:Raf kinase inhibitor-like YbhB/YbcL family protein